MSPTSPTWYDVLGVPPDASTEEIKRAWREATDRFEPGSASGQFRMYNEAADVLLDPRRRKEYDATLGARTSPAPSGVSVEEPSPPPVPRSEPAPRRTARPPARPDEDRSTATGPGRPGLPVVLTAVLAVLTLATLAVVGWLALQLREDARIDDARTEAPAAAEAAAKAMLSYDYRTLPEDRQRAKGYLTPGYQKKYLRTFALLEKNKDGSPGVAVQTKTVVSANVMGSGVVDAEADRARILVYVNQSSRKEGADPQVFQNRVTMTMERHGNRWLVDNLKSY